MSCVPAVPDERLRRLLGSDDLAQLRRRLRRHAGGTSGASAGHSGGGARPELWARAGILVNELARPALFLNLPTRSGACLAAEAGEPAYASLRALLRSPPALAVDGRPVYVCENPNIVAIAPTGLGCTARRSYARTGCRLPPSARC